MLETKLVIILGPELGFDLPRSCFKNVAAAAPRSSVSYAVCGIIQKRQIP